MGAHNVSRTVHAYGPVGGSAVVSHQSDSEGGHEFDEDDVKMFSGDREVLEVKPETPILEEVEESSDLHLTKSCHLLQMRLFSR